MSTLLRENLLQLANRLQAKQMMYQQGSRPDLFQNSNLTTVDMDEPTPNLFASIKQETPPPSDQVAVASTRNARNAKMPERRVRLLGVAAVVCAAERAARSVAGG